MNAQCESMQRDILLAQSGDLSGQELEGLREHLASCEACRKYKTDMERIISLSSVALSAVEPSAEVQARIIAAARDEKEGKALMFPASSLRWALSSAAAVLLACGFGLWMLGERPVNQVSHVSAIVLALGAEEQMDALSVSGKAEKEQELRALASHLLLMEGFGTDELQEVEFIDAGDEPLPTALQSRNIDVFELQKCV